MRKGLIFLRWTAHVASMIAPVALFVSILSAQSQPAPSNRADTQRSQPNQTPAQPPINVTVTAPQPSPEDAAREEQYRQREVVAQEDVRDFTRWLTYLTFIQAFIGTVALLLTRRAANAARDSADSAKQSANALKLINRQWVDVREYDFSTDAAGPRFIVHFKNSTPRPITLTRLIVLSSKAGDGLDQSGLDQILIPQDTYEGVLELDQADANGFFAEGQRVEMDVVGAIYFNDSFGDPQRQLFGRYLVRRSNEQHIVAPIAGGLRYRWLHLLKLHPDVTPPPDKHEG